jgi:hypothetical protein
MRTKTLISTFFLWQMEKVLLKHNVYFFALKYAANAETLTTGLIVALNGNHSLTQYKPDEVLNN